jgi:outer membrane receptor protein involved in Fe transport
MSFRNRSIGKLFIWGAMIVTMSLGQVMVAQAQVLEEIVVTAQRREQSLQDVPVSLQTFQGDELTRQGFDTLSELTTYAPGLVIKAGSEEQGLILRGAGTQSKNLGIEQGVPTFIDGIHMGRGSQVLNSYMDIQRVEVLKGPQPVFFGQNAAAGALNIETRKPGDAWEGNLTGEFGNFGKKVVEGAFGGPVTDTFGVRVAAKYYRLEGFMRDFFTGDKFPEREYQTFRITTQWTPTDNFQATFKFETASNDLGPRVNVVALDKFGNLNDADLTHGLRIPITGLLSANIAPTTLGVGEITNLGYRYGPTYINPRVESQLGVAQGLPALTEASGSNSGIVLDFTECQRAGGLQVFQPGDALSNGETVAGAGGTGTLPIRPSQFESCNHADESGSKPWHAIMDLNYTFDNGIELASKTGYSGQKFYNSPFNSGGGAFATNSRARGEFFGQWSEEIRLSSPTGGQIEWMGGLYWQKNTLNAWSDAYRANSRNPLRATRTYDDSKWISGFATVTFNFLDNRASIDIGARYTDIHKEGGGQNRVAEWIVEDSITGDLVQLPYGQDNTDSNAGRDLATGTFLAANPGLINASVVGRTVITSNCARLLGSNDPLGRGNVGSQRCASNAATIDDTSFDPQIVLRYRPSDDVSLYAKYATSFKSGAFDMAVSEITADVDDFTFGPENYDILEFGARGTFMDGRMALEATIFATNIKGNQVSFVDRTEGRDRNITSNVGAQKSDGIEFSGKFAASDRLTLSAYLALLDGTILDFTTSVCTDDDRAQGRCIASDGSGPTVGRAAGSADRSGQEARNAPDWQYTGNLRYELPTILSGYYSNFDITVQGTDNYTTDRSFSDVVAYDSSWDLNLSYEFGGEDDRWSVLMYARNLLEAKPVYNAANDFSGEGLIESSLQLTTSNFASYGARLKYNFF